MGPAAVQSPRRPRRRQSPVVRHRFMGGGDIPQASATRIDTNERPSRSGI